MKKSEKTPTVVSRADRVAASTDGALGVPVVSVSLITYNHAPYIRECLDSLLMQETNFPYEICLGEDESTDGTREICIEYAEKHPDKINLLLNSQSEPGREGYASQGVYNFIKTTRACRGKYLALCDGDDAWIDPHKLQKQYDIMEADAGISLIHTNVDKVQETKGLRLGSNIKNKTGEKRYSAEDASRLRADLILGGYTIASSTTFMRMRDVLEIFKRNRELFRTLPMGDIPIWCELVDFGAFYYIDEALALYRFCPESDSNSMRAEKKYRFVNGAANMGMMLGEKYSLPMDVMYADKIKNCNRYALVSGEIGEICRLHAGYKQYFSLFELLIYRINLIKPIRLIFGNLFQLKYLIRQISS